MFQISKCPRVTVVLSYWEASGEVSKLSYKSLLFDSSRRSYCIFLSSDDVFLFFSRDDFFLSRNDIFLSSDDILLFFSRDDVSLPRNDIFLKRGDIFLLRGSAGILCIYIKNVRITIGNSAIVLWIIEKLI